MKSVAIHGRRWFDKVNGNTYHSVQVFVDGLWLFTMPMDYGYDDGYIQTAEDELEKRGHMPGREHHDNGSAEPISYYTRDRDISLYTMVADVPRERDLDQVKGVG